ncbi:MAG: hypothetical protein HYX21_02880 [Candidatus Yanofskybacteria bacterium]|nr:hypothetical protein [Candidatus Yanofskybacteria bacterium]
MAKYCMLVSDEEESHVVCDCGEDVFVRGLEPLRKKSLDFALDQLETKGQVKKCSCCEHRVVVCRDCVDDDIFLCICCRKEADELPEFYNSDDDFRELAGVFEGHDGYDE